MMALAYTTKEINRNFIIKVYGNGINKAVGVTGLLALIGEELTNKLLSRAFGTTEDKCVCKLRRGLKITFYLH